MKKLILLLFLVSAFSYSCKETTSKETTSKEATPKETTSKETTSENVINLVTPDEMKELSLMDDVQLVDVRTPEEFLEGHIKGFQNIDFRSDTFKEDLDKLDKTKPIIVYCKSGFRSGKSCEIMKEKGFVKIYDLDGGIEKWKFEGNKVQVE